MNKDKYKRIDWSKLDRSKRTGIPGEHITCCFEVELKEEELSNRNVGNLYGKKNCY